MFPIDANFVACSTLQVVVASNLIKKRTLTVGPDNEVRSEPSLRSAENEFARSRGSVKKLSKSGLSISIVYP